MPRAAPEIAVVVPSHDRPVRLRWLLNALEEQTLDPSRFEVVVAHDSSGSETEELLRTHPLARAGVLSHLTFPPGPGPAEKRNAGWRTARAPLIAFTDDDCRPPADWLERALAAAARDPGAIVQGRTAVDPHEAPLRIAGAHTMTQEIEPPTAWAETCNIVYPRETLERAGGFDERLPVPAGEDTDLAMRARAGGAHYAGAPELLTYHAVEPMSLLRRLRTAWRWQDLAYLVRRHPELRRQCHFRIFWRLEHAWLLLAAAGAAGSRRRRAFALLALPWIARRMPAYGPSPRGRLRALIELPSRALIDLVEIAALARGSARHRTLFL